MAPGQWSHDALSYSELLAHRAMDPPPSSSLGAEERLSSLLLRAAARDSRCSQLKITATSELQRALNTVRWAMSRESTPEISITFRKTRAELAQISLRRVMHPLLFPTASTV